MPLDHESRSRASAPAIALSIIAASRTVLLIGPRCDRSPTALGILWHKAKRLLEAKDAAKRGRNADRAGAIAPLRQRTETGGDRRRRPATRSTGCLCQVPRIERGTKHAVPRVALPAKFRGVGLPQHDDSGRVQTLGDRGIFFRYPGGVDQRATRGADAARRCQILDRGRYARQRRRVSVSVGPLRRARLLQRQLGGDDRERIERWIEVLDAVQNGVRDLDW